MAAASGQPQDTPKIKKSVTPEQRKLYTILGVAGALALVGGGVYSSGMLSGGSDTPAVDTSAATTATSPELESPPPGADGAAGVVDAGTPAGAPAAATTAATVKGAAFPVTRFRRDPFQRVYLIPTPVPVAPPAPTPAPPVVLPNPVDVPGVNEVSPMSPGGLPGVSPIGLPGGGGPGAARSARPQQPLNLPPVSFNRLNQTARRASNNDAFPPRRTAGGGAGGGTAGPSPSFDKRLSGVVIGDGVRALLEIQGPRGVVTRVVQPGDEVDGVTVLNIQRFNDGTRTVTRMLIRENGEERSVELRAGQGVAPGNPEGAPGEQ